MFRLKEMIMAGWWPMCLLARKMSVKSLSAQDWHGFTSITVGNGYAVPGGFLKKMRGENKEVSGLEIHMSLPGNGRDKNAHAGLVGSKVLFAKR